MSEKRLAEIRKRLETIPEGPYFVNFDEAEAGEHTKSGLAVVDTGREFEWPIARLCEWPCAEFIANAPTDIAFLLDELAAAKAQSVQSAMQFVAEGAQQAIDGHQGADAYYCGYRDALGHFTDADTLAKIFNAVQASPLLKPGEKGK